MQKAEGDKVETGNWKLETRRSKLVCGEPRAEIRSLEFLERVVRGFQFPISNFQFPKRVGKLALALVAAFSTLANTTALRAQSCAMCYNTAAAAKAAAIQALRSGILILLVPVALMFIGIFILAFRSKERFCELSGQQTDYSQELGNCFESLPPTVSQQVSKSVSRWVSRPTG
jgi:hypothetical protein